MSTYKWILLEEAIRSFYLETLFILLIDVNLLTLGSEQLYIGKVSGYFCVRIYNFRKYVRMYNCRDMKNIGVWEADVDNRHRGKNGGYAIALLNYCKWGGCRTTVFRGRHQAAKISLDLRLRII